MKNINKILNNIVINTFLVLLISPLLILCIWSFTNSWSWPHILPKEFSLRGLEYLINMESIKSLIISAIISMLVSLITVMITIPASKALSLYEFRGKRFFELLFLAPIIVPTISIAMGIHIFFLKINLANTIVGVILVNIIPCVPYAIRILTDVYNVIGDKLEIQAKVLGASKVNTFRYITLPLLSSGIVSAYSMSFIISFGQYFLTFLVGGGKVITYSMIMFPYIQSGDRTIASLYSVVFLIVSLGVLLIIEKTIKKHYNKENIYF